MGWGGVVGCGRGGVALWGCPSITPAPPAIPLFLWPKADHVLLPCLAPPPPPGVATIESTAADLATQPSLKISQNHPQLTISQSLEISQISREHLGTSRFGTNPQYLVSQDILATGVAAMDELTGPEK